MGKNTAFPQDTTRRSNYKHQAACRSQNKSLSGIHRITMVSTPRIRESSPLRPPSGRAAGT